MSDIPPITAPPAIVKPTRVKREDNLLKKPAQRNQPGRKQTPADNSPAQHIDEIV